MRVSAVEPDHKEADFYLPKFDKGTHQGERLEPSFVSLLLFPAHRRCLDDEARGVTATHIRRPS